MRDKRETSRRVVHRMLNRNLSTAFRRFTDGPCLEAAEDLAEQLKSAHPHRSEMDPLPPTSTISRRERR